MGERIKNATLLQNQIEDRHLLQEGAMKRKQKEYDRKYLEKESIKESMIARKNNAMKFRENVKKALLTEALKNIYLGSYRNPSEEEIAVCEALLGNYIEEQGASTLLFGFKEKSSFLENLYNTVDKHYSIITEEVDEEDEDSMVLTKQNMNDFLEDIGKTEDMEDITSTIRLRVANAEEEFLTQVEKDKHNLNSIIKDTASRIQSQKDGLDNDYGDSTDESPDEGVELPEDDIQQEAVRMAKRKIREVQEHSLNVFGKMVQNIAKASVVDTSLREQYGADNGRIDMDKVVSSARCMYTMLEMVSTLMIEEVDNTYIKDTLDSINK